MSCEYTRLVKFLICVYLTSKLFSFSPTAILICELQRFVFNDFTSVSVIKFFLITEFSSTFHTILDNQAGS